MGLHGLHWRLGCLLLLPLLTGQGSERYLDVCAREPERAPERKFSSQHLPDQRVGVPPRTGHSLHVPKCTTGVQKPTSSSPHVLGGV